jgi:ABC-type transport system substrate-binding protein
MNPLRKAVIGTVLVGSTVLGGAVGATLVGSAGAAETTTSSTSPAAAATAPDTTSGQPAGQQPRDPSQGGHMANGITETLLTGDAKTKAEAAAQAAVPDGTIERSETDAEGAAYEVHMTKSDGSEVTVKLDSSFNVTGTETGRG